MGGSAIEIIREAFKKGQPMPHMYIGEVKSVDGLLCNVDIAGIEYEVNLEVADGGDVNKVLMTPKVGSDVLVSDLTGEKRYFVLVKCEQIDSVETQIGTTIFKVDSDGVLIKRGDEKLSSLLSDFIAEVKKIIVISGTSPNVVALTAIDTKIKSVLK